MNMLTHPVLEDGEPGELAKLPEEANLTSSPRNLCEAKLWTGSQTCSRLAKTPFLGRWQTKLPRSQELRALMEIKDFTDSLLLPLKRQKEGVTLRILKCVIFQVILSSSLSSKGSFLICVTKIREQDKKWELLALSLSLAVVSRQKLLFAATSYCSSSSSPQRQPSALGPFCTWHGTNNCTVPFHRWVLFKERNTFLYVLP